MGKADRTIRPVRLALIVGLLLAAVMTAWVVCDEIRRAGERDAACQMVRHLERVHASRRAAAAQRPGPVVAFLGDSYTQGLFLDDPLHAFPYVVADRLDVAPLVDAEAGSGFVAGGVCSGGVFNERLETVLASAPAVLVIQGGLNELGATDEYDAASELLTRVRRQSPELPVVLIGPVTPEEHGPEDAVLSTVAALRTAANTHDATFLDLSRVDLSFLQDGFHADAAGHRMIGRMVSRAVRDEAWRTFR